MPGYRKRVLALFSRDPYVLMVAMRDGHRRVIGVALHPDFLLGVDEMPLRLAITTMKRHERKCWLAVEVGYLDDAHVIAGVPIATERFAEPMTVEECAERYGYSIETTRSYVARARKHLREALADGLESTLSRPYQDANERRLERLLKTV